MNARTSKLINHYAAYIGRSAKVLKRNWHKIPARLRLGMRRKMADEVEWAKIPF